MLGVSPLNFTVEVSSKYEDNHATYTVTATSETEGLAEIFIEDVLPKVPFTEGLLTSPPSSAVTGKLDGGKGGGIGR